MNPEVLAISIPIVAIVMGFGMGMLGLWFDYRKKREIFELHHKERMAAIEKGMEVPPLPPELFRDPRRRREPADYLRRGLVLLLVGIAIVIALLVTPGAGPQAAFWGLLPAAVGLAQLIFYFVERRRLRANPDADRQ